CLIAGAAGRSRARASPADRQRLPVKSVAECTVVQPDRARRAATRMRSSMGAIRAKPSRSGDSCERCCGSPGPSFNRSSDASGFRYVLRASSCVPDLPAATVLPDEIGFVLEFAVGMISDADNRFCGLTLFLVPLS